MLPKQSDTSLEVSAVSHAKQRGELDRQMLRNKLGLRKNQAVALTTRTLEAFLVDTMHFEDETILGPPRSDHRMQLVRHDFPNVQVGRVEISDT